MLCVEDGNLFKPHNKTDAMSQFESRVRRALSVVVLLPMLLLAARAQAQAQVSYGSTGAVQTYTVPVGAGAVLMQAAGAGGGGGGSDENGPGAAGGSGAAVSAFYVITAGGTLNVYVGGAGAPGFTSNFGHTCANSEGTGGTAGGAGGFAGGAGGNAGCSGWSGGGGGGGGASVIATSANAALLVAGGGGGGQGGSWNSTSVTSQNPGVIGVLPGTVGGTGATFAAGGDGGGGGGGGAGCPGGAGGTTHDDNSGTNYGNSAIFGGSCSNANVTQFALLATPGGAGGAGQVASDSATDPGGQAGSPGSASITPLYALKVSVFADTGSGGGTANDGVQNGTEPGIGSVVLTASSGGVVIATATTSPTGSTTLWLPGTAKGTTVTITPVAPSGYIVTGGSAGTTAGTYLRPSVNFSFGANQSYSGVTFGLIPTSTLAPSGDGTVVPGGVAFYPHTFTSGSAGQVTFGTSAVANPTLAGWGELIYLDSACSGQISSSDPLVRAPLAATAGQVICLLVREFAPFTAPTNASNRVTLTATFAYSGTAAPPASVLAVTDLTTVTSYGTAQLMKRVQNVTAGSSYGTSGTVLPGQTLQYQLTVINQGSAAFSTLVVDDATPAFTTFLSAACPTTASLPAGLTSCSVATQPVVGGTGALQWTFAGTLASGGQTTVTFQVQVAR